MDDVQDHGANCALVRMMFDDVLKAFSQLDNYIASNANIFKHPDFENAIISIMKKRHLDLTYLELRKTLHLLSEDGPARSSNQDLLTPLQRAQKRLSDMHRSSSPYMDLRFLRPTTCAVERLFSLAGRVLTKERRSMHPVNAEMQIFLHMNSELWDINDIAAPLDVE